MTIHITHFQYEGPDALEQKSTLRRLSDETISSRAESMLGDREGCVSVYRDGFMVASLVRQALGDSAYSEEVS